MRWRAHVALTVIVRRRLEVTGPCESEGGHGDGGNAQPSETVP